MATALAVVETISGGVGKSLTGSAGAVANKDTAIEQSQFDVLSQIREISKNSLRTIGEVRDKIADMLSFDKKKARDEAAALRELAAEGKGKGKGKGIAPLGVGAGPGMEPPDEKSMFGGAGILDFLGLTVIGKKLKKLFRPLLLMFGPKGKFARLLAPLTRLLPFLGRFGPIGMIIAGISLLVKYSDEIAEALAPAIEGIKKGLVKLKPVFDAIAKVMDVIIKSSLVAIGTGLEIAVAGIEASLTMLWNSIVLVKEIVMGIITLDMERIKKAFKNWGKEWKETFDKLITTIKNAFIGMVNKVGEIFGVENAWDFIKEKWQEIKDAITGGFNTAIKWITDKWEDFAVEPFNTLKEKLGEWKKKIWDPEEGKLFGITLPEFSLEGCDEILLGWRNKIFNPEDMTLFGMQLPTFSLEGVKETLSGWGKKIYDHKEKKLFTMQLPTFSLSGIKDTLTGFRNMIYNPDTGAVFGIEFGKLFNNIKMPNFGDIFDSLVGAILPEPGSGWFADKLYRFFPDLKDLAQKAADMGSGVHTQNVDGTSTVNLPNAEEFSGVKFEKADIKKDKTAAGLIKNSDPNANVLISNVQGGTTYYKSDSTTHVGPLNGSTDLEDAAMRSGALALRTGKFG